MRLLRSALPLAALAAAQSTTSTSSDSSSSEPCARAARMYEESQRGIIPAKLAYDCLKSVPVAVSDGDLIDQLKLVWGWHSETGALKDTPDSWELGSVDLLGGLDHIKSSLSSYTSEYDAQLAIKDLTIRTGNFHFNYLPDILQVFSFQRTVDISTVSEDGTTVPKTYVTDDLMVKDANSNAKISHITKINDEEVQDFLIKRAAGEQYIDENARFNNLMSTPTVRGSFSSPNAFGWYEGPTTTLKFANGTERSYDNIAEVYKPLTGITNGRSFFQKLCTGEYTSFEAFLETIPLMSTPHRLSTPHHWGKRAVIPHGSYPEAVVSDNTGSVAGYFLDSPGFDDVAVLKIISFYVEGQNATVFQKTVLDFLKESKNAGKEKLIIDLRDNGGGSPQLLLDTFMQLFPGDIPFSGQRYRAREPFKQIGETVNAMYSDDMIRAQIELGFGTDLATALGARYWAYWEFVDAYGDSFKSWEDYYGPHEVNGEEYTTLTRYNLSNSNPVSVLQGGFKFIHPTGEPVFKAENMVMLTDGLCGSACASFHEEMKNSAGVRTVTVGGRAKDGPMQGVAGSKGGEVLGINFLSIPIQAMLNLTEAAGVFEFDDPVLEALANPRPLLTRAGNGDTRIQMQDQVRKGDKSGYALEFIYEAADCRLYYTAETLFHAEAMWEAAWSAFKDDSQCITNSTNHPSSISGGYKPAGPGDMDGKLSDDDENAATPMLKPSLMVSVAVVLLSFML